MTPLEAYSGTKVTVPTPEGSVQLSIPAGSQNGSKLRLRGKGIQQKDKPKGDLIAHLEIVMPPGHSEEVEEALKTVEEAFEAIRARASSSDCFTCNSARGLRPGRCVSRETPIARPRLTPSSPGLRSRPWASKPKSEKPCRSSKPPACSVGPSRSPVPRAPRSRSTGNAVLCFCSNNYLGLADHPALVAAPASAQDEGVGAAASRLISGTMDAHRDAEAAYADFLGTPAAALFSTGYAANVGTVQALAGTGDVIFSDALNHASLIDGCRLSRAEVHVYAHRDVDHLGSLLREHRPRAGRALIITDSLFSMDGVTAPLREIAELARSFDAGLLVDEAHALGVFGPNGRGLAAELGVRARRRRWHSGQVVRCGRRVRRSQRRGRLAHPQPSPELRLLDRAAPHARTRRDRRLRLVREADDARHALLDNASELRSRLRALGFEVPRRDVRFFLY